MRRCYFCDRILLKSGLFCQQCQEKLRRGELSFPGDRGCLKAEESKKQNSLQQNMVLEQSKEIEPQSENRKGQIQNNTEEDRKKLVTRLLAEREAAEDARAKKESMQWLSYAMPRNNDHKEKKKSNTVNVPQMKKHETSDEEVRNEIIRILKSVDFGLNAYGIRQRSMILAYVSIDRVIDCLESLCQKQVIKCVISRNKKAFSCYKINHIIPVKKQSDDIETLDARRSTLEESLQVVKSEEKGSNKEVLSHVKELNQEITVSSETKSIGIPSDAFIEQEILRILKNADHPIPAGEIQYRSGDLRKIPVDDIVSALVRLLRDSKLFESISDDGRQYVYSIMDPKKKTYTDPLMLMIQSRKEKGRMEPTIEHEIQEKNDAVAIINDINNEKSLPVEDKNCKPIKRSSEIESESIVKPEDASYSGCRLFTLSDRELREYLDNHRDCTEPLASLLCTKAEYYADLQFDNEDLSFRVNRILSEEKVQFVGQLLEMSPQALLALRTFGLTSLLQVVKYLISIIKTSRVPVQEKNEKNGELIHPRTADEIFFIVRNCDRFAANEYDQVVAENIGSERYVQITNNLRDNHDWLDFSMLRFALMDPAKARKVNELLDSYVMHVSLSQVLEASIQNLPEYKRTNQASYYIAAYKAISSDKELLKELYAKTGGKLQDIVQSCAVNEENLPLVKRFLNWCNFDPAREMDITLQSVFAADRLETIIRLRAEGKTLDQIGVRFNLTRERIRQLEKKAVDKFHRQQRASNWILKVCADRNGDLTLTRSELSEYCGDYTAEVVYFLKSNTASTTYRYSKMMDVFIIASDGSEETRIKNYVDKLPNSFSAENLKSIVEEARDTEDLSPELLEAYIKGIYTYTDGLYVRSKLRRTDMYRYIMSACFPNGIRIYDADQMREFRIRFAANFGDGELPAQDRAIGARISDLGILCDKGTYKLKQDKYISEGLAQEIETFISSNRSPILPISYVYKQFARKLNAENVNNMYYMLGILHELFDEKFYIRKHYVSSQKEGVDVNGVIQQAILDAKKPVSQEKLLRVIPGLAQVTVAMAVDSPDILNYWGNYFHGDNTRASMMERRGIEELLKNLVSDGQPHDSTELYNQVSKGYSYVLHKNYVYDKYACFSLLQYWYRDRFGFARPYIAEKGVRIEKPSVRLNRFVYSKDELTLNDLTSFLKEIGYERLSLLSYIKQCNDRFFLYSNTWLISYEKLGIDQQMAEEVESVILPYVKGTMAIRDLPCFQDLPKIDYGWTDWLVYSTIRKWSKKMSVGESSNQLRLAVPLIAPAGELDESKVNVVAKQQVSFTADNMDNLDELLEDMIEWEDLEMV